MLSKCTQDVMVIFLPFSYRISRRSDPYVSNYLEGYPYGKNMEWMTVHESSISRWLKNCTEKGLVNGFFST